MAMPGGCIRRPMAMQCPIGQAILNSLSVMNLRASEAGRCLRILAHRLDRMTSRKMKAAAVLAMAQNLLCNCKMGKSCICTCRARRATAGLHH